MLYKPTLEGKFFIRLSYIGYKHQFAYTPYILRAKVTRAGPFPPTIATLAVHRLRCVYCAPTVPLLYAYSIVIAYSAIAVD